MFFAFPCIFVQNVQAIEFPEITAQQLKAKMDAGEKLLLVNPLSDIEYNAEHIPGSINIPLQNMLRTNKLPKDPDQLIVTYCLGRK
jgi:rhodanese-related sulfurtransferase